MNHTTEQFYVRNLRSPATAAAMRMFTQQVVDIPIDVKNSAPQRNVMELFWAFVDHRVKAAKKRSKNRG